MKNKRVKQMIVDVTLKGRKLYWFGGKSKKFLANSLDDVIDVHVETLGTVEVEDIVACGGLGEIKMTYADWFKLNCWDCELMKMVPTISAAYGTGTIQVSTSYY